PYCRGIQKNWPRALKAHLCDLPPRTKVELWFQDEARIGQKNGIVRQWAKRGTRPRQPADQRYKSAYLFGAICPARGVGAGMALPFADTEAMQDRKSTRLNSSHVKISYAVFCLKKKKVCSRPD